MRLWHLASGTPRCARCPGARSRNWIGPRLFQALSKGASLCGPGGPRAIRVPYRFQPRVVWSCRCADPGSRVLQSV
eukprot:4997772-Alexandrium_andersonii.AAC.1